MKKVLILYTELADYMVACIKELNNSSVEIHLVRWPSKGEAPFKFTIPSGITVYEREEFSTRAMKEVAVKIQPDLILCSGWMDKGYVAVCRKFYGKIPTVSGMDNHWKGSLKQQVARIVSPFTLKRIFSHIWVPGAPQEKYASKLGFRKNKILRGFYCANTPYFNGFYNAYSSVKKVNLPKRFLYVGRYVEFKGIFDMWKAFTELQQEKQNDWELWCLGTGDDWDKRIMHPKIKHIGFVQPAELGNYLKQTGVFLLPSHKEPWGVVVHEMVAAGFPLLCSNTIGAATAFLEQGKNGFLFEAGNKNDIKKKMKKVMNLQDEQLFEMGEYSHFLGQKLTPEKWAKEILTIA